MNVIIDFFLSINLIPCFNVREKWVKNNFLNNFRSGNNENCAENFGNLHFPFFFFFFFFFSWGTLPSSTLKDRPPEIGVNPALCSDLWKKYYPSCGPANNRKRQRRGYSQAALPQEWQWPMQILYYVCLFVTKNMGMFIATVFSVKR